MAVFQFFNAINSRSQNLSIFKKGFFSNKYFLGALLVASSLQVAAIYLFGPFLGTVPFSPFDWFEVILVSSTVLFADELRKYYQKSKNK